MATALMLREIKRRSDLKPAHLVDFHDEDDYEGGNCGGAERLKGSPLTRTRQRKSRRVVSTEN